MASAQVSESFNAYDEEFQAIKDSVLSKLGADAVQQRGEQRKATLRRITMELEEMDEIVDQMEMEAKGKAKLMIKVRAYKGEIKGFKSKVTSLSAVSDRDLLLAQPAHSSYAMDVDDDDTSFNSPAAAQRTRLLASQQTLQTSSGRLENAERTAAESETIGGSILDQLRGQRVQLQGANDELQEADGSIAKASNTIKKMARLASRQRYMLIGFIVVLVLLIGLILWNKFR
ncbi:vesicle transport v-snare protein vti1 [Leucosporidium creatinivorum]|uniref:Vesicle transport v-snare protein vti1 n=1 Tax=Leucosporidium creatinivorum TaxID=106004 RepID=A0A1Y2EQV4_9BASI|nr:vesicle transport v-snare protein vti1 [Leucosporidium creatinivorum]